MIKVFSCVSKAIKSGFKNKWSKNKIPCKESSMICDGIWLLSNLCFKKFVTGIKSSHKLAGSKSCNISQIIKDLVWRILGGGGGGECSNLIQGLFRVYGLKIFRIVFTVIFIKRHTNLSESRLNFNTIYFSCILIINYPEFLFSFLLN